ncbi:MAG: methionine gamma-lyase family protein, partial [Oscillospiraceae bacterium]
KNPGGGIAPTGGYIAGKKELVELCAHRLTAPGTGGEIGCTLDILREMYLGLYYAPGVVADAVKTSIYASCLLELMGKDVLPSYKDERNDIITSIAMGSEKAMCDFCEGIQSLSPIDSFARPEPCAMPGYDSPIIMAAGAFTMGSSIELSCDGPVRAPYILYLQGGLNFTAS